MKVKNSTMQAFPFIEPQEDDNIRAYHPGMTLRDYFAAQVAVGAMSEYWNGDRLGDPTFKDIAQQAYSLADAMMEARK